MCLSIPSQILEIHENIAKADIGGTQFEIGLDLIQEPKVGDFVLIHSGYAIEKLDPVIAQETLDLIAEMVVE